MKDLEQIGSEFREWWTRYDVLRVHTGKQELNHPIMGRLVMHATTLQVVDHPDVRLIVYTPLPEEDTANKLAVLAGLAPTNRYLLKV